MKEGPTLTDEDGQLPAPYLSCRGCKYRRIHDYHYFYCRDLGDQSKADMDPYNGGLARLWGYPHPNKECRFLPQLAAT